MVILLVTIVVLALLLLIFEVYFCGSLFVFLVFQVLGDKTVHGDKIDLSLWISWQPLKSGVIYGFTALAALHMLHEIWCLHNRTAHRIGTFWGVLLELVKSCATVLRAWPSYSCSVDNVVTWCNRAWMWCLITTSPFVYSWRATIVANANADAAEIARLRSTEAVHLRATGAARKLAAATRTHGSRQRGEAASHTRSLSPVHSALPAAGAFEGSSGTMSAQPWLVLYLVLVFAVLAPIATHQLSVVFASFAHPAPFTTQPDA
jgi:hypothetical protein